MASPLAAKAKAADRPKANGNNDKWPQLLRGYEGFSCREARRMTLPQFISSSSLSLSASMASDASAADAAVAASPNPEIKDMGRLWAEALAEEEKKHKTEKKAAKKEKKAMKARKQARDAKKKRKTSTLDFDSRSPLNKRTSSSHSD